MLLYQELLRTEPWDFLLALAVVIVVAAVPIIVSLGLRIQERRSEEERPIAWLNEIPREAAHVGADGASADGSGADAAGNSPAGAHTPDASSRS